MCRKARGDAMKRVGALHQFAGLPPGPLNRSSVDICDCHNTGPFAPLFTCRIDLVVSATHDFVAGQL
jgi:hypothetical protein